MSIWGSGDCSHNMVEYNSSVITTVPNYSINYITITFSIPPRKLTDAEIFDEYVKETHKIPQDPEVWRKLNVVNVLYTWDEQGFYKAHAFDFKDDTSYEGRKVY